MGHRQQVVAGRDARAALVHDGVARGWIEQGLEFRAQLSRRLEAAVGAEVVLEEAVASPRNVAGGAVQWFHLTTETFRCSGVDETDLAPLVDLIDAATLQAPGCQSEAVATAASVLSSPSQAPSRTATSAWPSQRSIHQARAA